MSILNLHGWQVIEQSERKNDYRIIAEYIKEPQVCPHCFSSLISRNGTRRALFMDTPIRGKRVGIEAIRKRYICKNLSCGKSFSQSLLGIDDKRDATTRLVQYIREQSLKRTFSSIADEVGVAVNTIKNVFGQHVISLELSHKPKTPRWLGIDEIHIIKRPRCVLANIRENTIFDLLVNRNKSLVARRVSNLDVRAVELVAMDMWQPYRDVVLELVPQANIIVDKFHVVRMANVALETVRKSTRKSLSEKIRRKLVKDRFILLRRHQDLDDFDKLSLDLWSKEFPLLGKAYWLKEDFYDVYQATDRFEAMERYREWLVSVPKELEPAFGEMLKAIRNWEKHIFAYFDHAPRVTNAFTESLNNLIRHVNRNGRGYSFDVLRAKLLYGEGVKKYQRPVYQRSEWKHTDSMAHSGVLYSLPDNPYLGASISTWNQKFEKNEF